MPYQSVDELPAAVQDKYSSTQQRAFMAAFNSVMDACKDDTQSCESRAFGAGHAAAQRAEKQLGFKLFGNGLYVAQYTNPYIDGDGEIVAEKAIDADIDRMQSTGEYPPLWYWHLPIQLGETLAVVKAGRFAVAIGKVDDNPIARKIVQHAVKEGWQLSHGFRYDPAQTAGNTYYSIRTFEVSLLPADKASNPFTAFNIMKEQDPMSNSEALQQLKSLLGEDVVSQLVQESEQKSKVLDDANVSRKEQMAPMPEEKMYGEQKEDGEDMASMMSQMHAMISSIDERVGMLEERMRGGEKQIEEAPKEDEMDKSLKALIQQVKKELREEMQTPSRSVQGAQNPQVIIDDYLSAGVKQQGPTLLENTLKAMGLGG